MNNPWYNRPTRHPNWWAALAIIIVVTLYLYQLP